MGQGNSVKVLSVTTVFLVKMQAKMVSETGSALLSAISKVSFILIKVCEAVHLHTPEWAATDITKSAK